MNGVSPSPQLLFGQPVHIESHVAQIEYNCVKQTSKYLYRKETTLPGSVKEKREIVHHFNKVLAQIDATVRDYTFWFNTNYFCLFHCLAEEHKLVEEIPLKPSTVLTKDLQCTSNAMYLFIDNKRVLRSFQPRYYDRMRFEAFRSPKLDELIEDTDSFDMKDGSLWIARSGSHGIEICISKESKIVLFDGGNRIYKSVHYNEVYGVNQKSAISITSLELNPNCKEQHRPLCISYITKNKDALCTVRQVFRQGKVIGSRRLGGLLPAHQKTTSFVYWTTKDLCYFETSPNSLTKPRRLLSLSQLRKIALSNLSSQISIVENSWKIKDISYNKILGTLCIYMESIILDYYERVGNKTRGDKRQTLLTLVEIPIFTNKSGKMIQLCDLLE